MSSRERFEAWHEEYLKKDIQLHTKWDVWKARDAEVEAARKDIETLYHIISEKDAEVTRLVEALREAVNTGGLANDLVRDRIDALLREYEETRDE